MKRPFLPFVLLTVLALLTGCLDFERETVTYHHDAKTDTLRFHLVYHGIYGAEGRPGLSEQEQTQLHDVLTNERAFFFFNWIFEYDRKRIKEELEKARDPNENGDKPAALVAKRKKLLELLLANVRVENGPFFLDDHSRLCGVQRVTLQKVSEIVRAANELIREELRPMVDNPMTDDDEREAIRRSLAKAGEFLRLAGNRLTLRWPMTREDHEKQFGEQASEETKSALGEFGEQGGHFAWEGGEVFTHVGTTNRQHATLTLRGGKKHYTPNAVHAVRARAKILEKFDATAAAKAFVETGKTP